MKNTEAYLFVIDTDSYSGNFEREMCAYITGQLGECGVGDDYIDESLTYDMFEDKVFTYFNDHGCARPVEIFDNPRHFNDGLGDFYKKGQEQEAFEKYKAKADSCSSYVADVIRSRTFEDFCSKQCLAYLSVAIAFKNKPSPELIALVKERAHQFLEVYDRKYTQRFNRDGDKITIEGFRLVEVIKEIIIEEL
jgi:hypothetical protein